MPQRWQPDPDTGAALIENIEASAKLTTANGGTFTWAQLDSVANHVTACSIGNWRALTWLATATGWTRRKRSAICSGKLVMSTWFDTTWIGGTASRLYMCKSVVSSHCKLVSGWVLWKRKIDTALWAHVAGERTLPFTLAGRPGSS